MVLALDDGALLDQRAERPAIDGAVGRAGGLQGQLALRATGYSRGLDSTDR
jgi:hypothetical protein